MLIPPTQYTPPVHKSSRSGSHRMPRIPKPATANRHIRTSKRSPVQTGRNPSKAGLKSHTKNKHRSEQAAASLFGHWSEQTPKGESPQQARTAKTVGRPGKAWSRRQFYLEDPGLIDDAQEPETRGYWGCRNSKVKHMGSTALVQETGNQNPMPHRIPKRSPMQADEKIHRRPYERKVKGRVPTLQRRTNITKQVSDQTKSTKTKTHKEAKINTIGQSSLWRQEHRLQTRTQ